MLKREYEPLVKRFAGGCSLLLFVVRRQLNLPLSWSTTGNFQIGSVIKTCFASLSTEEDALAVEAFFADKDTSLYNQALLQVCHLPFHIQ